MRKRKADRNIRLRNKIFFVTAILCAVCVLCMTTYAALSKWQEGQRTLSNENVIADIVRDNTVPERNRLGFSKNNSLTCELTEKQIQTEDMDVLYPYLVNYPFEDIQKLINSHIYESIEKHCGLAGECSYEVTYEVKCNNGKYLSVLFCGMRSGGSQTAVGIHPYDIAWGVTIDVSDGMLLSITDVISDNELQAKLDAREFEQAGGGIKINVYEELEGEENWYSRYEDLSIDASDKEHNYDFYIADDRIGILFGVIIGDYIIVEMGCIQQTDGVEQLEIIIAGAQRILAAYGRERIVFTQYSNHFGTNDIEVSYPKLQEIEGIDVQKINSLIENDLMRIFENNQLYKENNYCLHLKCEVAYLGNNIISIQYKGFDGPGILVKSYYEKALGTTIDMKSEKVLHLEDIITDFDGLSELLMEDKFEAIEIWAGEEPDKLSACLQGKDKNTFIKELQTYGSGYIENVEWYTDGSAVVIIYGNLTERYYGEYSGSKEMLAGITDLRFWKKMN